MEREKKPVVNKTLIIFSPMLFLIIFLVSTTAYVIATRQINRSYIEQQLTIASETIKLRLSTEINSELSLLLKMADTTAIRNYFINPGDSELQALAQGEFDLYQQHFKEKMVFWVNDVDKIFYATGIESYVIDPYDPEAYWYNMTLFETENYNFNINYNESLQQINLWVNAPVFITEDGVRRPVGMVGSGIELTDFSNFVAYTHKEFDKNVTSYLFNHFNEITSAADFELIYNKVHIADHLGDAGAEMTRIAAQLTEYESQFFIHGGNIYQVSSIPEMAWYLVVSYPMPGILALNQAMNMIFFGMLLIILLMLVVLNVFFANSENTMAKQNIKLVEANRLAESASRAKSEFLATMSHEMRTPLSAVIGLSEIELRGELPDSTRNSLVQIRQSGSSLLGIINDILDISKIEAEALTLIPVTYDTALFISDAVNLNRVRIGAKPIVFVLEISGDFPGKLWGDELRGKQILNNLLSNAIKYTKEGTVTLTVDWENAPDGRALIRFAVRDTGIGICSEDIKKLFSNYIQLDARANRKIEGTGLGLGITKKLVEMMGGKISASSEYGKGSVFTAEIIQGIEDPQPIGEETAAALRSFHYTGGRKEENIIYTQMSYGKVLVVDDMPVNLLVACGLLEPYALSVDTATSGREAFDMVKAAQKPYDLIFMDHMMPGMDGIEATALIRAWQQEQSKPATPVIALTANALTGNKEMFLSEGFDGFISKPIDIIQLDEALNTWIRDKQSAEVLRQAEKDKKM